MENLLATVTVQLFYHPVKAPEREWSPQQIASGVLIKTQGEHFLITAKHVLREISINDIIIFLNRDNYIRLTGEIGWYELDNTYDNLDILILKLEADLVNQFIKQYQFLDSVSIDFFHNYKPENKYILFGFINGKTKLKNKTFLADSFFFLTEMVWFKKIADLGLNYVENITLKYNRRKQTSLFGGNLEMGPRDLTGLSGGGIWHVIQDKINPNLYNCSLVGIMTEHLRGTNRGVIVGTKICLITGILKIRFSISLK